MSESDSTTDVFREPTFFEVMAAVRKPEVLYNVPIHVCILIPVTSFIAYLATRIDQRLGWERFLSIELGLILFGLLFPLGIFIVWYSYGYLAIVGKGSPATHLGGTTQLVTTGPFAYCRHPSILGKFAGVVALGLFVGSPTFFFVIIPLLTAYSLLTVRFLQEKLCLKLWGDDYIAYRKRVPLVIPRFR